MNKIQKTITKGERISYGLFAFGAILAYYMIASYLQLYMTDIGIPAIAVGVIFIIAKVWDAINDPIFGVVVDKVNLKKGKYIPWLKIASIAIPLTTIFVFIIPAGVSMQIKVIWATIAYILWDTSYTLYDVPTNAIVTTMTENIQERNRLYATASFFVYLGGIMIAIAVPMLYPMIGWGMTSVIIGVLCFLSMLPLRFKVKERFVSADQKEASIKEIIMCLLHNKYLLIYTAASIIGSITNFSITLNGYFAIYCLGGEQWITILSLASAVPVLLVVLFVPKLFEKTDKFKACIVTRMISIVIDIIIYLVGYSNAMLLISLIIVKNLFMGVWGVSAVMFIADCVEYGQFKTGERAQGIAFSTKAFTNKIVIALSGAIAMFGLATYGFVEGSGAVQTQETIDGIWNLYSFAPIIGSIIAVIILLMFYKLRDHDVQIMTKCNNGEITKEEALASFVRKF